MAAPQVAHAALHRTVEAAAIVALVPLLVVALLTLPANARSSRNALDAVDRLHAWADGRTASDGLRAAPLRPLRRPTAFLGVQLGLGILAAAIWALIMLGLITGASMLVGAATGGPVAVFDAPAGAVTWESVLWFGPPGLVLLFLALCGLAGTCWLSRLARAAFSRPAAEDLERQVRSLSTTLDDVVVAVDGERRRIERDIHDGVQQRVVALSLLLARVERTVPGQEQDALLSRARDEVQTVLDDLRDRTTLPTPCTSTRVLIPPPASNGTRTSRAAPTSRRRQPPSMRRARPSPTRSSTPGRRGWRSGSPVNSAR